MRGEGGPGETGGGERAQVVVPDFGGPVRGCVEDDFGNVQNTVLKDKNSYLYPLSSSPADAHPGVSRRGGGRGARRGRPRCAPRVGRGGEEGAMREEDRGLRELREAEEEAHRARDEALRLARENLFTVYNQETLRFVGGENGAVCWGKRSESFAKFRYFETSPREP